MPQWSSNHGGRVGLPLQCGTSSAPCQLPVASCLWRHGLAAEATREDWRQGYVREGDRPRRTVKNGPQPMRAAAPNHAGCGTQPCGLRPPTMRAAAPNHAGCGCTGARVHGCHRFCGADNHPRRACSQDRTLARSVPRRLREQQPLRSHWHPGACASCARARASTPYLRSFFSLVAARALQHCVIVHGASGSGKSYMVEVPPAPLLPPAMPTPAHPPAQPQLPPSLRASSPSTAAQNVLHK